MDYKKLIEEKTKYDIEKRENLRSKCPYFPCHNVDIDAFDCRACYCPLYEICGQTKDEIFGGYLLKNGIWACENCILMHNKETVEKVIALRKEGKEYNQIYEILKKDYKENSN